MPEKIGFLFPGQGAQFVGMGKDFYQHYAPAKKIFDLADNQLGYSLTKLCFEGPEDELTRTCYAQPAIFTFSIAVLETLKELFPELRPDFCAGLSLGEFSALTAAGAISFESGLSLVDKRAKAMELAAQERGGTMASIMGLSADQCAEIAMASGAEIANLNTPDQTVLSGSFQAIEQACRLAEEKGAKRALPLKVGGAFHSSLMESAKSGLEHALQDTIFMAPSCAFIPNASAADTRIPAEVKRLLALQLTSPVRWVETMQRAKELNMNFFIEIGPGKVLKGLAKKCYPEAVVENCGTITDIEKLQTLFAKI